MGVYFFKISYHAVLLGRPVERIYISRLYFVTIKLICKVILAFSNSAMKDIDCEKSYH